MTDKTLVPPHNLLAEQCLLASQMLTGQFGAKSNAEAIALLQDTISLSDYYSDVNRKIQSAIWAVHEKRAGDVDVVLVAEQLEAQGELSEIGGVPYLAELLESVPSSAHVAHYADLVTAAARRRRAIDIGQKLVASAHDKTKDDQEIIEAAHDAAMKMADMLLVKRSRPRPLSDHVGIVLDKLSQNELPTMYWGIPEIDAEIKGVMPGEMVVIGATPSVGKTLLAMQWLDCAARQGIPGMVVSEEMRADMLATRTINYMTALPDEDWKANVAALHKKTKEHFAVRAPILVAETCGTIAKAERAIERAVRSHGIKIVAVDYAQILDGRGDTQEQKVADVAKSLKAIAMKHELVMILLAQLNRSLTSRENSAPRLSDLKDSGALEAVADVALFPYRPWMVDNNYAEPNEYRIYVRKNRSRGLRNAYVLMRIEPERQRVVKWDGGTADENLINKYF